MNLKLRAVGLDAGESGGYGYHPAISLQGLVIWQSPKVYTLQDMAEQEALEKFETLLRGLLNDGRVHSLDGHGDCRYCGEHEPAEGSRCAAPVGGPE